MNGTVIPSLSASEREHIKKVVKYHFNIDAEDGDINRIDERLRNHYYMLHEQNIIRNLVPLNIRKILAKYKDKGLGLKLIFRYLASAYESYSVGIPICSIFLCRTALEAGLRERLAEEQAEGNIHDSNKLPRRIWERMKKLENKKLSELIHMAEEKDIITRKEIEDSFKPLKFGNYSSRKVFDKFIHGDLGWIVKFVENKDKEFATVIGAKDILEEKKFVADAYANHVAVIALVGTTIVAERLYFKSKENER